MSFGYATVQARTVVAEVSSTQLLDSLSLARRNRMVIRYLALVVVGLSFTTQAHSQGAMPPGGDPMGGYSTPPPPAPPPTTTTTTAPPPPTTTTTTTTTTAPPPPP